MNREDELFTIQQVSTKLNIPKPTLRFWEKELDGILVPIRTLGKQRRYNLEHLAIIGMVRELREKGMGLAEIKKQNNNSNKGDNSNSKRIDLLVARVTEVVRAEVNRFFEEDKEIEE
jgi:DNA-binding transcriptional MerR regulator